MVEKRSASSAVELNKLVHGTVTTPNRLYPSE